ncbi:MAG: radical SAM family heme chaperone HemW [Ignavibacteriae bacterium]|nr:MAG: radical SAM family heme chaperone HemW [Ignavibacteriota bacterium]
MASLYLHIPFCEHKCIYCDFYSVVPAEAGEAQKPLTARFLSALELEIRARAEDARFQEPFETVFFGGGTPSLLQPSEIENILNLLASRFPILPDAEITLETNPGTVDRKKLSAFRSAGINRISMGIQSFYDDDLKFLTRIHTAAEAKQCVFDAAAAGFKNVSVDLIFSLPLQSVERWKSNLEQAIELQPAHISCYSLIIEPGTPLFSMVQSKQVTPLDTESDAALYELTIAMLASHGYRQYEVSNFAKPDFKCRHNINYWNHTNYLSFGPSAHSFWKNERWWNSSDLGSYIGQLNERRMPVSGGEHLSESKLMEEALFLGLRSEGIDIEKYRRRFGVDLLAGNAPFISELIQEGRARIENGILKLTATGYLVCDEICQSITLIGRPDTP